MGFEFVIGGPQEGVTFYCQPSPSQVAFLHFFCVLDVYSLGTSEALLGVLGIRDNWQNNFRDKG